ncbi:outer membrane protein OmpW [Paraglaciecola psychrophila 170]|uniref:Outer membrane protein OmpW n=1 Tax=Paraglaciecola psychrophila 170 TaxID=1129794 RepID=M4RLC0_9ALTE|nr:outer membrane protein OmpW [Paraglaciecola psychrophila 170]
MSLDNSLGLAAQVGADYMLNYRWFINGALRWIYIDTGASFNLNAAEVSVDSIEIDSWIYSVTLGYRF